VDRESTRLIEFDPETHVYRVDGRTLPSVTDVLGIIQDFSAVPPDVLEAAKQFGKHVHQAINLFNRDELDWRALNPALVPFVERWRAFLDESGAIVIASEQQVAHARLGFAGTPDVVLSWGKRTVTRTSRRRLWCRRQSGHRPRPTRRPTNRCTAGVSQIATAST